MTSLFAKRRMLWIQNYALSRVLAYYWFEDYDVSLFNRESENTSVKYDIFPSCFSQNFVSGFHIQLERIRSRGIFLLIAATW